VPEPEGDDQKFGVTSTRADRTETVATVGALVWVSVIAVVDAIYGGKFGLVGFLFVGPFIAATFAGPKRTALVGLLVVFFSLILSTPPRQYDQFNHLLRVLTAIACAGVALWISSLRTQRDQQLRTARTETRNERRRRVAAETTERMQAMARALTTAADPAQVADAFFAALRDELHVDAATFATMDDRGVLRAHRRFGYASAEQHDSLLSAMDPDGAVGQVLQRNVALFADSRDELEAEWPAIAASFSGHEFSSLALVPLVVSDRAVGVVVVHWVNPRSITRADKSFLFTITGAAAQAVERARLTVTEFTNLQRNQHLHDLSSSLAAATTPGDVARAATAGGRRALGAQSAAFRVPVAGERALTCLASSGSPALLSRRDVEVKDTPSGAAFDLGCTQVITFGASEEPGGGAASELVSGVLAELEAPVTIVTEPLMGSVGALGVLALAFVDQAIPGEPELRFLSTLAALTAQALERAQVFEHERQALRDAETGRERLSLLSEVTKLLSSSLDPTTVTERTMSLVVGRLADACVVQVPGESGLQCLHVQGADAFSVEAAARLFPADDVPFDCDAPEAIAYRTGRPQLAPFAAADTSTLAIPLTAMGEVFGVMTFINTPGRQFEPDDISLAAEVASRAGVALSNATRFQREHVVAEVLQRAVLPDSLPTVAGLHFDAEYRAGAAGTYVGGDWYDVFQLDGEHIVFSVGDVMGKGAAAAALMGQVRSAVRAYAVTGQSPAEILSSLDRLFDVMVDDRVVTVVVGIINPTTGAVVLSNAGHPPPLVVRAEGTASYAATQSSLLIAAGLGGPVRPSQELFLHPGDTLVMYSDGLLERRGELVTVGMERLAEVATVIAAEGWPAEPAAVLATLLSDDESADDVVVLSLSYLGIANEVELAPSGGTGRDGMSTLRLNPVVESTPMARHWIAAHLRDFPPDVAECAGLLTSELVTNAVLHANTPLSVTLHMLSDRIRVDVADRNPVVPSLKDYGADAATGRGLTLFNALAKDWGVQKAEGGKIVWFELPASYNSEPSGVSDGSFHFDLLGQADPELHPLTDVSPSVDIVLLGMPVALLQKASEEYEGLFRELRLMRELSASHPASPSLPDRLSVLVAEIGTRFNGLGPGKDEAWQDVVDRHLPTFDWKLSLPTSALAACEFYDAMLDEADAFGLSAQLLSLPATDTSVAVRRWLISELIGQLGGRPPVAWKDSPYCSDGARRAEPAATPGPST